MWPGEQPPGGAQNSQQDAGGGQPNPYQQPGYQQPNPYGQQAPWNAPTAPAGAAVPPPTGGGNRTDRRTRVVAIVAAAAVVVAAGVTGFVLFGGGEDDKAGPEPAKSGSQQPSSSDPRNSDALKPTIAGWKVVFNPDTGIAFDVPAQWAPSSKDWVSYVVAHDDPDGDPLIAMKAPAFLQEKWCGFDDDLDGTKDYSPLGAAGSKGNNGAKNPAEIARSNPRTWVYGMYTQPDESKVKSGQVTPYTTKSGIKGSLGTAWSTGVEKSKKCVTDGKATTFAFKDPEGDLVSWSFYGPKGVSDEVPDATVRKILGTVRLSKDPSES
ncbi:hypothetical protein ACFVYF_12345 [Streptomyces sp. NPDC058274]|uniref:hypothetical protein n=1 Tax=Streptomyces sp. NPDC058274 TaxID=3346416 RepID=UPI0036EC3E23